MSDDQPRRGAGRFGIVALLLAALVASGFSGFWARQRREMAVTGRRGEAPALVRSASSLDAMPNFALALLLGGLRGPLVMILWTSSETQKNERNLEDFDTQVEWIRRLQPEFDSVHIFQMWNKAYNISVQMASLANKYITILDALNYGHSVDRERPDNINIISQIAQIYFDKLGSSQEKQYYRKRVRAETLPHKSRQTLRRDDPGWRPLEMETMLTADGRIQPELLQPTRSRPADLPAGEDWNNGAELQYLEQIQPFPYGLSPFALAYNDFKRAQILQRVGKQKHIQLSSLVVDSRPALALKNWSEEEFERGRRAELGAFGLAIPKERLDMELPTADLAPQAGVPHPGWIDEAVFSYRRSAQLVPAAVKEYDRHMREYLTNVGTYRSHIDGLEAMAPVAMGDADYLQAMTPGIDAARQGQLLASAKAHYESAIPKLQRTMLKYYVSRDAVEPLLPPVSDATTDYVRRIEQLPAEQLHGILRQSLATMSRGGYDQYGEDRIEYEKYMQRVRSRLTHLHG